MAVAIIILLFSFLCLWGASLNVKSVPLPHGCRLGDNKGIHILCRPIPGQEEPYLGCAISEDRPVLISLEFVLYFTFFFFASDYVLSNDPQCYFFLLLTILLGNHYRSAGAELRVMRGKVRCPVPEEPCCRCSDPSTP